MIKKEIVWAVVFLSGWIYVLTGHETIMMAKICIGLSFVMMFVHSLDFEGILKSMSKGCCPECFDVRKRVCKDIACHCHTPPVTEVKP